MKRRSPCCIPATAPIRAEFHLHPHTTLIGWSFVYWGERGWLVGWLIISCCACIGMKWWIDSNDGVYKLKVLLLQQPCPDLLSSVEELLLTNISVSEWQLQDASVWRSSINHACSREDDERTNDSHHHDGFAPSSPLCSSHSSSSRP